MGASSGLPENVALVLAPEPARASLLAIGAAVLAARRALKLLRMRRARSRPGG